MTLTEYDKQEQMELVKEEGRIEGRTGGKAEGDAKRLVKSVDAVIKHFNVDLETACSGNDVTVEQYLEAKAMLVK